MIASTSAAPVSGPRFITSASDDGVGPLRDVEEAATHADPRTTMPRRLRQGFLDPTYILATLVASASR